MSYVLASHKGGLDYLWHYGSELLCSIVAPITASSAQEMMLIDFLLMPLGFAGGGYAYVRVVNT
jgi:hypothetical protein